MAWKSTNPWRCWERMTMPAVLHGPEALLVRVALYDTQTKTYQSEFRWPALDRLGPNDYQGNYAQVTLRFCGIRWSFEMASDQQDVFIKVESLEPEKSKNIQVRLETIYQRQGHGKIVTREESVIAKHHESSWEVHSPSPTSHRTGSTITNPLSRPFFAIIQGSDDGGTRLESRDVGARVPAESDAPLTDEELEITEKIAKARREYLSKFSKVPSEIWWAYCGVPYGIGWNMIWAQDLQQPIEVCSRDWCVHGNYGEWVLFNWDMWVLACAAADYDVELAHQIVKPQIELQTPEGLIPGVASPIGIAADRGMPPMASLGLYKAYLRSGDKSFVTEYYERLTRYHAWWKRNRDGNGDGLYEWGSNPVEPAHPQWQTHSDWASRYETGMDNHPMWDNVIFNPETNTQEQADAGLNALLALDALILSKMATVIGRTIEAERYLAESQQLGKLMDKQLWNNEIGLWLSRNWNGNWNTTASPCCFYPLYLPTNNPDHNRRAITDHLQNPKRFGGHYVMPVSPRDDPAYPDQYYVRGRIWPEQTLLVHWALREAGDEAAATELANGALRTMKQEWLEEGHLHENYHAETADGDDTPESDPLYSFGIFMPLIGWLNLFDVKLDGTPVTCDLSAMKEHLDKNDELRKKVDPIS